MIKQENKKLVRVNSSCVRVKEQIWTYDKTTGSSSYSFAIIESYPGRAFLLHWCTSVGGDQLRPIPIRPCMDASLTFCICLMVVVVLFDVVLLFEDVNVVFDSTSVEDMVSCKNCDSPTLIFDSCSGVIFIFLFLLSKLCVDRNFFCFFFLSFFHSFSILLLFFFADFEF